MIETRFINKFLEKYWFGQIGLFWVQKWLIPVTESIVKNFKFWRNEIGQ